MSTAAGPDLDVLIVGGGLTGCALALALARTSRAVGLVETQLPVPSAASFDERHLGLSLASVRALEALGVWQRVREATQAITSIHISSQGEFGSARLDASAHGLAEFGRVCPARVLGQALNEAVAALPALELLRPAQLLGAEHSADSVCARLAQGGASLTLRTRLLVGADGTHSLVRQLAGLTAISHDYGQTAVVSNLESSRPHAGQACERLTRDGPLALLPLPGDRRCGLVWTQSHADAKRRLALDEQQFADELQEALGWRLGRIQRIGRRQGWPLARVQTLPSASPPARMVLIGNAAQTLHPMAAQGFNLGLRDALGLAAAISAQSDAGAAATLTSFSVARSADRARTLAFSHGLVEMTGLRSLPAGWMRSAGLVALDALPALKDRLVQFGTGFGRG